MVRALLALVLFFPLAAGQLSAVPTSIELSATPPAAPLVPGGPAALVPLTVAHVLGAPSATTTSPIDVRLSIVEAPHGVRVTLDPPTLSFAHAPCAGCSSEREERVVNVTLAVDEGTPAARLLKLTLLAESEESGPYAGARDDIDVRLDVAWVGRGSAVLEPARVALQANTPRPVTLRLQNDGNAPALFRFDIAEAPRGIVGGPPATTRVDAGEAREVPWQIVPAQDWEAGDLVLSASLGYAMELDRTVPLAPMRVAIIGPPEIVSRPTNAPAEPTPNEERDSPAAPVLLAVAFAGAIALWRRAR